MSLDPDDVIERIEGRHYVNQGNRFYLTFITRKGRILEPNEPTGGGVPMAMGYVGCYLLTLDGRQGLWFERLRTTWFCY